ncbi:MAG: beta-lactamase family protein [Planctomycetes bacterium]|nr:beta-lactamase family protein [Planctomycetota bacterium]
MNLAILIRIAILFLLTLAVSRSAPAKEHANRLPHAAPAEAGMNAEPLNLIAPAMRQFVEEGQISGAVTLVARQGKIIHHAAVGDADIDAGRQMQKDTIFAIASMTKPITATAVMILRDEGKLSLDDPVSKFIPEFKNATLEGKPLEQEITVRRLLTHTSGLAGSQQNEGTLKNTAEALAGRPLAFAPGARWSYSPGLSVAGRVVEVASGASFDEFLQKRIFEPLAMNDTTFHPTPEQQKRISRLYKPGEEKGSLAATTHWLSELSPDRTPNPSGGLFSTAADMAQFYQMILNGGEVDGRRIVSREAVEEMTSIQTGELTTGFTPGNGWGLGWCVVREPQGVSRMLSPGSFGHGGAFGTQGWIDPKREMIFVLMIQRTEFGNSDASKIRETLQKLAVEAAEGAE